MFDFWPVYSSERFRASWPSCLQLQWFVQSLKELLDLRYVLVMGYLGGVYRQETVSEKTTRVNCGRNRDALSARVVAPDPAICR